MAYNHYDFLPQPYYARVSGIYAIVNRNNNKLYVGSASKLSSRWNGHRHDFHIRKQNPHLLRAFEKDRDAFYLEVIEELPGASKEFILSREQFWIDFYKSYIRGNGYNMAPKAESVSGIVRTEECRKKQSVRLKGVKWSEERKAHFRKTRRVPSGWKWSEERRKIQLAAHARTKWTEASRAKHLEWLKNNAGYCSEEVMQFTKDGTLVAEYPSISEAERVFGVRSNISSVCKGKRRKAFGFIWRYKRDGDGQVFESPINRKTQIVELVCNFCGKRYDRPLREINRDTKYCSLSCVGKSRRKS